MREVVVPISVGELVDKVTILRIKAREITDQVKLGHIHTELQALVQVCSDCGIDLTQPDVVLLEEINTKLWRIEDEIREHERAKTFAAAFIALARAVYVTNDERAAVKARINKASGSALHEAKSYHEYRS